MKTIIAFSLWGDNPTYTAGAIKNADLALEIYPGWVCRYYVGKSVPKDIVCTLIGRANTEVFVMSKDGDWSVSRQISYRNTRGIKWSNNSIPCLKHLLRSRGC